MANEAGAEGKRKAIEKVLGEPIFDDFSDNTLKIRRNLLVAAFLVVIYKLNGLSVGADASVAGVKIVGSGYSSGTSWPAGWSSSGGCLFSLGLGPAGGLGPTVILAWEESSSKQGA